MLLIMTVHPGFGGQSFRPEQMDKVKRAAKWNESQRKIDIEVDGGINAETASSRSKTARMSSSPELRFSTLRRLRESDSRVARSE